MKSSRILLIASLAMLPLMASQAMAAGTVSAKAYTGISISHKQQNDDGAADLEIPSHTDTPAVFASGSSAGQVNKEFTDEGSISASSSATLDLSGSLLDGLNGTVAFANINAIEIIADATNTNNVIVGAAGSNPFVGPMGGTAPTVTLPPGGRLEWVHPGAGWGVTDSSNDQLKIANSGAGTAVGYRIKIVGR